MGLLNINGFHEQSKDLKAEIINSINADIMCITETKLINDDKIDLSEYGYSFYGLNRKELHRHAPTGSGGVGILLKSDILTEFNVEVLDSSFDGILLLSLTNKISEFNVLIYVCYLPPENSTRGRDASSFFNHLLYLNYLYTDYDRLIITGDFNARIGQLSDMDNIIDEVPMRKQSADDKINRHGEDLIDFLLESRLCLLNGRTQNPSDSNYTFCHTRGLSVVDYVIVPYDQIKLCSNMQIENCTELINNFGLEELCNGPSKIPDHCAITFDMGLREIVVVEDESQNSNLDPHIFMRNKLNPKYSIRNIPPEFLHLDRVGETVNAIINAIEVNNESQIEIDRIYSDFKTLLVSELDNFFPIYDGSKNKKKWKPCKPYWNDELTVLWKDMHAKETKFYKFKGGRQIREQLRQEYKTSLWNFDKLLRTQKRRYERGQLLEIEEINTKNPSEFWKRINKLGPRKPRDKIELECYIDNGEISKDPRVVLDKWAQDYESLYNVQNGDFDEDFYNYCINEQKLYENRINDPLYISNVLLNENWKMEELEKALTHLKNDSAPGYDRIPASIIKNQALRNLLLKFYQLCLDTGKIPDEWYQSLICPIPKPGTTDYRTPLSFRGIHLLNTTYKIYSSMINNRLSIYTENGILADTQNGFRAKRSCTEHVYVLDSVIKHANSQGRVLYSCFIDLRKAFDFVDRDMLMLKLLQNSIDGKFYYAIKSLYVNPQYCVQVNNLVTSWFPSTNGVKQGDSLSPLLFSLYINDLLNEIDHLNLGVELTDNLTLSVLAYADDLVIFSDDPEKLQILLNYVSEWCHRWRMQINSDKTKVVQFRSRRQGSENVTFQINGIKLEQVTHYKYLGVVMDEHLEYDLCVNTLSNAARRALGKIIYKSKSLSGLGYETYTKLYNSMVAPIMDYGCEIWGLISPKQANKVHMMAQRYFLGVHRFAPVAAVTGDMGWTGISDRWKTKMVSFYNRLSNTNQDRLLYKVFLFNNETNNDNNWNKRLQNSLGDFDLEHNFETNSSINIQDFKSKLSNTNRTNWLNTLDTKPKLRTYKQFKTEYKSELYVTSNLDKFERSLIAQLRLGILPLHIETGRYVNLKPEERICKMCSQNNIEDELHFLFQCDLYTQERTQFMQKMSDSNANFSTEADINKLRIIMENNIYIFGKYLKTIFNKRRQTIYSK